jgi:hypothetical protein
MELKDIITAVLATYGALLATFSYWSQRKNLAYHISINLIFGSHYLTVRAMNLGEKDVALKEITVAFYKPMYKRIFIRLLHMVPFLKRKGALGSVFSSDFLKNSNPEFPIVLASGRATEVKFDSEVVAEYFTGQLFHQPKTQARVQFVFIDELGKRYSSSPTWVKKTSLSLTRPDASIPRRNDN